MKSETYSRGAAPSLVESFGILGLHGYRSISLASPYSATILIAKNGSGKTTLLGVLDAFLKAQFTRLRDLQFTEIRCKINGIESELVLKHEDVIHLLDLPTDSEISRSARKYEVEPYVLFRFLSEEFDQIKDNYSIMSDDPIYNSVWKKLGYRHDSTLNTLVKLRECLFRHSPVADNLDQILREIFKGIDVIYLPTYRRIELPLDTDQDERAPYRKKKPRFRFPSSIFAGDIQFDLSDIFQRLSDLNQAILVDSNRGYRQISADIVNELIDGTFEKYNFDDEEIPSKDELSLFFSRLKEGRRVGPFNEVSIPKIDKIYTGDDIPVASNKFLKYFLSKLNKVIKATRGIETRVEDFIGNCNKYLSSQDDSASLPDSESKNLRAVNVDDKVLRLDRKNLKVFAESVPSGRKISLDALSSGEKQMISLFAKLFLYPNEKLILIDEPELSLSLDWQRQILPDVIGAPSCRQVIAITHSPFVFDNDLEPFARSLRLSIDITAPLLPIEDEGVELDD